MDCRWRVLAQTGHGLAVRLTTERTLRSLGCAIVLSFGFGAAGLALVIKGFAAMIRSVGVMPPTASQKSEEADEAHPLFRHLPQLRGKIAWRQLGTFPTPVHSVEVIPPGGHNPVKFSVKREDLASAHYGGNKVRTLQHLLAVVEAKVALGTVKDILVLGSAGSNQVVASIVHSRRLSTPMPKMLATWFCPDEPDLDNTLNMLSTFSFPTSGAIPWTAPLTCFRTIFQHLCSGCSIVLPPGGNTPAGVLGQVAGALELAEQIDCGEVKDVDRIYLPIGSACTISGLILGVLVAKSAGLKAFQREDFKICGCMVEHNLARLERWLGLHKPKLMRHTPLSVRHTLEGTCAVIKDLGGPNLLEDAMTFLDKHVVIEASADVVGRYGAHSSRSKAVSVAYDETGRTYDATGQEAKPLWLCGHFMAKAAARMLEDIRSEATDDRHYLLWQTKSAVQPRGDEDEWPRLLAMDSKVHDTLSAR